MTNRTANNDLRYGCDIEHLPILKDRSYQGASLRACGRRSRFLYFYKITLLPCFNSLRALFNDFGQCHDRWSRTPSEQTQPYLGHTIFVPLERSPSMRLYFGFYHHACLHLSQYHLSADRQQGTRSSGQSHIWQESPAHAVPVIFCRWSYGGSTEDKPAAPAPHLWCNGKGRWMVWVKYAFWQISVSTEGFCWFVEVIDFLRQAIFLHLDVADCFPMLSWWWLVFSPVTFCEPHFNEHHINFCSNNHEYRSGFEQVSDTLVVRSLFNQSLLP